MVIGIPGLIVAYVLVAVLLLSLNLYSKWPWSVKAAAIGLTCLFYLVSYFSFPPLLGWPTKQTPPAVFRLIATKVQQPDKITDDGGAIYLWLQTMEKGVTKPRAYTLPYSKLLHEAVIGAQEKLEKGIEQLGEYDESEPMQQVTLDSPEIGQESLNIQFHDIPDPLFPDK